MTSLIFALIKRYVVENVFVIGLQAVNRQLSDLYDRFFSSPVSFSQLKN